MFRCAKTNSLAYTGNQLEGRGGGEWPCRTPPTQSTLAQGGWVGHDEGRALNTDASNAQTVSATESVPSRHRRQGTGGAAAAHLNIDASNAQTSRQYLPRAMYIPYGTYIIQAIPVR